MQLCAMDAGHEEELMKNIKHLGAAVIQQPRPMLAVLYRPLLFYTGSSATLPH